MSNLKNNVAALLQRRGWTQVQLADAADVDPATISRVLQGTSTLVSDSLPKLAKALGVSTADLLASKAAHTHIQSVGHRRLPAWTFSEAIHFVYSSPTIQHDESRLPKDQRYVLTDKTYSEAAYVLEISDGAMAPELPAGAAVVVEPNRMPKPGKKIAVGYLEQGEPRVSVRFYHDKGHEEDGTPIFQAVPAQPAFRTLSSEETGVKLLGVIVERRFYEDEEA